MEIREPEGWKLVDSFDLQQKMADGICWANLEGKDYLLYTDGLATNKYTVNHLVLRSLSDKEGRPVRLKVPGLRPLGLSCAKDLSRLLVYREVAGKGEVSELKWEKAPPGGTLSVSRHWTIPEATYVTSLNANQNVFALRQGRETALYRWEGTPTPVEIWRSAGHFFELRETESNNRFLAVGDADGRQEIWLLNAENRSKKKMVSILGGTNSFFRKGQDWWLTSYRNGGYDIAVTKETRDEPEAPTHAAIPAPVSPSEKTTLTEERDYTAWSTIFPRTWIPSLLFVPNGAQFGFWIPAFDLSQKHTYDLIGGYDTRGIASREAVSYTNRFNQASFWEFKRLLVSKLPHRGPNPAKQLGRKRRNRHGYSPSFPPIVQLAMVFRKMENSSLGAGKLLRSAPRSA